MSIKDHEIASLFPLLSDIELRELAKNIRDMGLLVPIVLYENKILDGRNRYRACEIAGVTPKYIEWCGADPWEYVWSQNAERRHLPAGQKAALFLLKNKKSTAWQEGKRRIQTEANQKRSEAMEGRAYAPKGEVREGAGSRGPAPSDKVDGRSRHQTAKASGVSPKTAARAEALYNARPDLLDKVASGEMSLVEASRQKKKEDVKQQISMPTGKYRIIYADPPWNYRDKLIEGYGAAENHYPSMTIPELCAMPISDIADDNAVLFIWVTSPLLEDVFKIINAWGFKYKTSFVWDKIKHNMGHYNSVRHEFLLIATRGSCMPDTSKLFDSVQSIERTKHSEKPPEFREIINTLYPHGKRIELFARSQHDGWQVWGNQSSTTTLARHFSVQDALSMQ